MTSGYVGLDRLRWGDEMGAVRAGRILQAPLVLKIETSMGTGLG